MSFAIVMPIWYSNDKGQAIEERNVGRCQGVIP